MSDHHHSHHADPIEAGAQQDAPAATLRVDAQDEIGVIVQKIKNEAATTIRLMIPERSIAAQGMIGLRVLADEASKMDKSLEIASESAQVQMLARRAGLTLVSGTGAAIVHGFMPGQDAAMTSDATNASGPTAVPAAPTAASEISHKRTGLGRIHLGWVAVVVVGLFAVVGIGGLWAASYYLPQATVTVFTQQRSLDRDLSVTADPSATTADAKALVIPVTVITGDGSKSQSFPATGKKDIGDKAQGTVTLANYTSTDKIFPAGTKLTSNKLEFVTASVVKVPAETVDIFSFPHTTTPGTADVAISASALGEDSNLPAKSNFTIAGNSASDFSGQNKSALSGGTKKTVTIITADDRTEALASVTQDAQDAALDALKSQVEADQMLLDDAVKQKTTSTNYSNSVGEQVSQFSLTVKVTASGPVISEKDLTAMLNTAVEQKVPDGYTLDKEHSTVVNRVAKVDADGTVHLTSTFKTQILPQVDTAAMKSAIKGKNPQAVEQYLKGQPNLNGYDITLTPKLPGPFYKLPNIDSHIQIKVEVKS